MRSGKRFKPWSAACLWLLVIGLWTPAGATHQKAAEITFTHVSGYTYRFRLVTYTFTESAADRPELEVRWGDGSGSVLSRESETVVDGQQTKINVYTGTHTYAGPGSYYISMEDANRNGGRRQYAQQHQYAHVCRNAVGHQPLSVFRQQQPRADGPSRR